MEDSFLKDFLEEKVIAFNHPNFIASDPIQIPHGFSAKEDIEISAFLTATIAWGNRKSIIANSKALMQRMGNSPFDFVMDYSPRKEHLLTGFVHRTFNADDLGYFVVALQNMYRNHGGLESVFAQHAEEDSLQNAIHHFKRIFFELPHLLRTEKHVSDPQKNSAAKRINMFLRWMVRQDGAGVDFGIWNGLSPSQLSVPLDVHSGKVARKLGLLNRKQSDAKAVEELDRSLRKFDSADPVKYDFALFGLGAFENF